MVNLGRQASPWCQIPQPGHEWSHVHPGPSAPPHASTYALGQIGRLTQHCGPSRCSCVSLCTRHAGARRALKVGHRAARCHGSCGPRCHACGLPPPPPRPPPGRQPVMKPIPCCRRSCRPMQHAGGHAAARAPALGCRPAGGCAGRRVPGTAAPAAAATQRDGAAHGCGGGARRAVWRRHGAARGPLGGRRRRGAARHRQGAAGGAAWVRRWRLCRLPTAPSPTSSPTGR